MYQDAGCNSIEINKFVSGYVISENRVAGDSPSGTPAFSICFDVEVSNCLGNRHSLKGLFFVDVNI